MENNGSVLRTVNILKTKFNRLKDIKYALNIEKNDICACDISEQNSSATLADCDFGEIESKVSNVFVKNRKCSDLINSLRKCVKLSIF